MNKTTKALKLAEEALGELHYSNGTVKAVALLYSALAAIHEALAEQDKQEPVGYFLPPIDESDVWEEAINQDCPTAVPLDREPVSAEAIREALAEQDEQEPGAWHHPKCDGQCIACLIEKAVEDAYGTQGRDYMLRHINAAPVRTKDLTDDEMNNAYTHGYNKVELAIYLKHEAGLRAVIAADREKNK